MKDLISNNSMIKKYKYFIFHIEPLRVFHKKTQASTINQSSNMFSNLDYIISKAKSIFSLQSLYLTTQVSIFSTLYFSIFNSEYKLYINNLVHVRFFHISYYLNKSSC